MSESDEHRGDEPPAAEPTGCPKTMWDGPYSYPCGMGARVGVCATHGRFRHDTPPAPADPDRPCPHDDLHLDADVQRLTASDDDPTVVAYIVELQIHCKAEGCGERFRWTGVPAGMMPNRPACSADEFTLHAPIRPATADPDFGLGIPGFAIRYGAGGSR
ncbi:hypothetical protein GA0070610_1718 [Micromonospora echinofusca]|uniref:Uncharacterized protein n=1 Tax=Micromonospora echinofusca TaxID=47858 RepID=A0A1C5G6E9_MICEH|nr:hypothetical protein [Micromonospora echinofusca]SCG15485.1 hypothetical protein GA0070610_1718 [Micromonospora echinofusca]